MGWATDAVNGLRSGREVTVRPRGGSMRGRIEDGQLVTLGPVDPAVVKADDVVLVRWRGGYLLHIVKEATRDRLLIGNNVGRVNGWASRSAVVGRLVRVHPRGSEANPSAPPTAAGATGSPSGRYGCSIP